jgi:DNA-binding response OmpR family regulator
MSALFKILIVEDDATIARVIADELNAWGYDARRVTDFYAVTDELTRYEPQLVLLDLSLPYRSGFYWCGEIRKLSNVPVIFISSAADNMNMVRALHQGADDFIAKPFDFAVLIAKIRAILRRSYDFAAAQGERTTREARGAVLNLAAMTLTFNGSKAELSRNEFKILEALMDAPGAVVSRHSIIRRLWDDENFIDENTLTVNVNRLRKKLESISLNDFILTKKGEGYWVGN